MLHKFFGAFFIFSNISCDSRDCFIFRVTIMIHPSCCNDAYSLLCSLDVRFRILVLLLVYCHIRFGLKDFMPRRVSISLTSHNHSHTASPQALICQANNRLDLAQRFLIRNDLKPSSFSASPRIRSILLLVISFSSPCCTYCCVSKTHGLPFKLSNKFLVSIFYSYAVVIYEDHYCMKMYSTRW